MRTTRSGRVIGSSHSQGDMEQRLAESKKLLTELMQDVVSMFYSNAGTDPKVIGILDEWMEPLLTCEDYSSYFPNPEEANASWKSVTPPLNADSFIEKLKDAKLRDSTHNPHKKILKTFVRTLSECKHSDLGMEALGPLFRKIGPVLAKLSLAIPEAIKKTVIGVPHDTPPVKPRGPRKFDLSNIHVPAIDFNQSLDKESISSSQSQEETTGSQPELSKDTSTSATETSSGLSDRQSLNEGSGDSKTSGTSEEAEKLDDNTSTNIEQSASEPEQFNSEDTSASAKQISSESSSEQSSSTASEESTDSNISDDSSTAPIEKLESEIKKLIEENKSLTSELEKAARNAQRSSVILEQAKASREKDLAELIEVHEMQIKSALQQVKKNEDKLQAQQKEQKTQADNFIREIAQVNEAKQKAEERANAVEAELRQNAEESKKLQEAKEESEAAAKQLREKDIKQYEELARLQEIGTTNAREFARLKKEKEEVDEQLQEANNLVKKAQKNNGKLTAELNALRENTVNEIDALKQGEVKLRSLLDESLESVERQGEEKKELGTRLTKFQEEALAAAAEQKKTTAEQAKLIKDLKEKHEGFMRLLALVKKEKEEAIAAKDAAEARTQELEAAAAVFRKVPTTGANATSPAASKSNDYLAYACLAGSALLASASLTPLLTKLLDSSLMHFGIEAVTPEMLHSTSGLVVSCSALFAVLGGVSLIGDRTCAKAGTLSLLTLSAAAANYYESGAEKPLAITCLGAAVLFAGACYAHASKAAQLEIPVLTKS